MGATDLKARRAAENLGVRVNRTPGLSSGLGARIVMKIRNSLKSAKVRDKNCRVVRRRGRVYVINKKNPRLKARQG